MSAKIEVKRDSGYWSVYVNGARTVDRESYQVASNVAYHLENPDDWDNSESCEVAASIAKHLGLVKA